MKIEEIKKAIDAIQAKLEKAKEDYTDAARRCQQGIGFYPLLEDRRLEYKRGVYDGVERAWREVVFLQTELEKESE